MLPKDPMILLSYVNTMLRDRYEGLDDLCEGEDAERETLEQSLSSIGCVYDPEQNRFR